MNILLIAFLLIVIAYSVCMTGYAWKWKEMQPGNAGNAFVTVIIPVKNEASVIGNLLGDLANQTYRSFEIIVVDDHSTDETESVVRDFMPRNGTAVRWLESPDNGKKAAIEHAVHHATGELMLLTDADCRVNNTWVAAHASIYNESGASLIAGPVLIDAQDDFIELFQQLDYMALQVTGLASLRTRFPLMCSGANLSFSRNAFIELNGYEGNRHIASGDDTFLMFKMLAARRKVLPAISRELIVTTAPLKSWPAVLSQRKRWSGKVRYYKSAYVLLFGFLVVSANIAFILSLAFMLPAPSVFPLLIIALKILADWHVLKKGLRFFRVKESPSAFISGLLFYPVFLIMMLLQHEREWKKNAL